MNIDIRQFTEEEEYLASADMLGNYTGDDADPVPLLYQTGYLSLTGYEAEEQVFVLGYPNAEVKYGFMKCLLPEYARGLGKPI